MVILPVLLCKEFIRLALLPLDDDLISRCLAPWPEFYHFECIWAKGCLHGWHAKLQQDRCIHKQTAIIYTPLTPQFLVGWKVQQNKRTHFFTCGKWWRDDDNSVSNRKQCVLLYWPYQWGSIEACSNLHAFLMQSNHASQQRIGYKCLFVGIEEREEGVF